MNEDRIVELARAASAIIGEPVAAENPWQKGSRKWAIVEAFVSLSAASRWVTASDIVTHIATGENPIRGIDEVYVGRVIKQTFRGATRTAAFSLSCRPSSTLTSASLRGGSSSVAVSRARTQ